MSPPTAPELRISRDAVCYVIVKAREFDESEGVAGDDDSSSAVDDGRREMAPSDDAPAQEELTEFIDGLNIDEQCEMVALAWLGRGDYEVDQWDDAVQMARSRRTGPASSYLLGIPVLGDYLEEGLAAFGLSCDGA